MIAFEICFSIGPILTSTKELEGLIYFDAFQSNGWSRNRFGVEQTHLVDRQDFDTPSRAGNLDQQRLRFRQFAANGKSTLVWLDVHQRFSNAQKASNTTAI